VLSAARDAHGRQLRVVKLPCPPPLHYTEEEASGVDPMDGVKPRVAGKRMAASYINFYIANGGVVVPAFGVRDSDER
jgi:agmatine deiminase